MIFAVLILIFLWIFQIVFLNTYYKLEKTQSLIASMSVLVKSYDTNYKETFDSYSINNDICIEVVKEGEDSYSSFYYNKKCLSMNSTAFKNFKSDFISGKTTSKSAEIINPNFNNNTLVLAENLGNNTYIFISTSLVPLDSSVTILKSQFIVVAIIVLLIAIIISYFISRKLSNPIIKLNQAAKKIGKKEYDNNLPLDDTPREIVELSETLNDAVRELESNDKLRTELMANVGHDLKTPLTMIKAYAYAIKDLNSDNKEKREADLNIIIEEVDRLSLLVEDILELSKIEAGAYPMQMERFNISKMIKNILRRYDILEKEGYQFIFDCKKEAFVTGDVKRLEQVVYNLINNAVNYTGDDKKITIRQTNKKETVLIEVIDTGKGIDKKEIDLIWDKYYQINKNHKRNKFGTGLGLSIVKQILENHHCKYGVLSEKKKGTTFYFEIHK